jgi:TolA-binding protein
VRVENSHIPATSWMRARVLLAVGLFAAALLGGCSAHAPMYYMGALNDQEAGPARAGARETSARESFESAWQLVQAGEFAKGEDAFRVWLADRQGANDPQTPNAMFWLGYCLEKQGKAEQSRELYQQVIDRFAASPAAQQARQRLAP